MSNRKEFIYTLAVILIVSGGFILVQSNTTPSQTPDQGTQTATTTDEEAASTSTEESAEDKTKLEPLYVPEDWKVYSTNEWIFTYSDKKGGIAFAYPPDWNVKTVAQDRIFLSGDCNSDNPKCDYEITISSGGRGLPERDWTSPKYIIDGEQPDTWQAPRRGRENGYLQLISVDKGDLNKGHFLFEIYTQNRDLTDQFLETINLKFNKGVISENITEKDLDYETPENWSTYRNLGLAIDYPNHWEVRESEEEEVRGLSGKYPGGVRFIGDDYIFIVDPNLGMGLPPNTYRNVEPSEFISEEVIDMFGRIKVSEKINTEEDYNIFVTIHHPEIGGELFYLFRLNALGDQPVQEVKELMSKFISNVETTSLKTR